MDDDFDQHSPWYRRLAHRAKVAGPGESTRNGGVDVTGKNVLKKRDGTLALAMAHHAEVGYKLDERGERCDYQTGIFDDLGARHVDSTEMLHSLATAHFDLDATAEAMHKEVDENDPRILMERRRRLAQLESLPDPIWHLLASYLDLADRASLAMACWLTFAKMAHHAFPALTLSENKQQRLVFLSKLDVDLPYHLLCFHCGLYHLRIQPGLERVMAAYVNYPVVICPLVRTTVLPRTRLAHRRELPYAFVQLAVRAARFGPAYGVSHDALARRWRDSSSGWSHQTCYLVHRNRLLLRVRSETWVRPNLTPSEMRLLLFDRNDYTPYFSVCSHWRDGELTRICKCVLSHVPGPPPSIVQQIKNAPGAVLKHSPSQPQPGLGVSVGQCDFCAPGRRCLECPSEYVVNITRAEDKYDPVERFKFMLVVTRWCDLGDGSGPLTSPEWAAINGMISGYPSQEQVKNRALMGVFESAVTGVPPKNRLRSLNPNKGKRAGGGNDWY